MKRKHCFDSVGRGSASDTGRGHPVREWNEGISSRGETVESRRRGGSHSTEKSLETDRARRAGEEQNKYLLFGWLTHIFYITKDTCAVIALCRNLTQNPIVDASRRMSDAFI